jgi:DNA invertase Pin-like site-specific DNA recombinase
MTAGQSVIAYLRRSKPSGRTAEERAISEQREEASLTAQRRAIQYVCEFHGWQVAGWEQDVLSGKDMRRPGLRAALDQCDGGDVAAIIVATLDRLSRSSLDFELLMKRAVKRDWRILVADGNIDLSTADGRFMARVLMNAAQHEREKTSERTTSVLAVKKAEGVRLGRRSRGGILQGPYAFLREAGLTYQALADDLNDLEVPTLQGGTTWRPSSVRSILGRAT